MEGFNYSYTNYIGFIYEFRKICVKLKLMI